MKWFIIAVLVLATAAGCKSTAEMLSSVEPGTAVQVQAVGVQFAPGNPMAPFVLGHSHIAIQKAPTGDDLLINRIDTRAGLGGVRNTGTQASGPWGEQIQAAGGQATLDSLLQSRVPAALPTPAGATEPDPTAVLESQ